MSPVSSRVAQDRADPPFLLIEGWTQPVALEAEITTVGRGPGCDIQLDDPTVSRLHAELVRRGPHLYVSDLGLSTNGTSVNGRPVGRRTLHDGDVVGFGGTRARVGGMPEAASEPDTVDFGRVSAPPVTRREEEVLAILCRPALRHEPFVDPPSPSAIARELGVSEAAVKQHLMRLYHKFCIAEGPGRRGRLANQVIAIGLIRPAPDESAPASGGSAGDSQLRAL
jgi:hypothetical protein